uniref:NB-ARC domain-containing protein n=1 Tax=Oryza brachyantha TaxID=4533 RepID=J3L907_ORYBR
MGLVGTVVDAAIGWMVETILGSFFTGKMQGWLAEDMEMLESEMKRVQMVLAAADGRRIDNKPLSNSDELKELLYDAEDVMDELDYYRLQQQIEGGKACNVGAAACINPEGSCTKVASSCMNQIVSWAMDGRKRKREEEPTQNIMLPLEIKCDISKRINGIVKHLHIKGKSVQEVLHLEISGHNMASKQTQGMVRGRRLTTSIQVERKVHGRDVEKGIIKELLIKGNSSNLGVLPLVGVGGVGTKTTLARYVYHDQTIKDHFDLRMWVCVSNNFNEQRLTREMLEHVCRDTHEYENIISFNVLQKTLQEKIRHTRFLLVLDDMWEDGDMSRWEKLLASLKCNEADGCMILATTRKTSVARMIGTMSKVEVNGLDETNFWLLFKACAFFGNENQELNPTLQSIGKQIAKNLKGNPLAAGSVGALLNRSVSFEHWRKVQYKWKLLLEQDDDDNILSILKFSYEFLPVHLQRCFSYCSLFPEDHQFSAEKIVCAWMSQNFVRCESHTDRLEETGKQYLDDLVDYGFFEEVESHYVMHDLMHDLAEKVSQNECATVDGLESKKISPGVRHLSIITTAYDEEERFKFPSEKFENILQNITCPQKLRTLMFFGRNSIMLLPSLNALCKESKRLRLLKIYVTAADISSTHNLINPYHLRYLEFVVVPTTDMFGILNFVNTSVPQALTEFYHLEVLDASSGANLVVPTGMSKLVQLRHIFAHEKVHSTIAGVGNLTSLQELIFKVQDDSNFNIGQLRSMNELVTLRIYQLENVKTKKEANSARLIDKEHLQELSLSWNDNSMSSEPTTEKTRDDVLEGLEPHQNLRQLQLSRYSGATSPNWLANNVTSLQTLHLENCREWRIVKSLEMLPVLRKLKLIRMWNLISVSVPSYLEELILVNAPKLEKCLGTFGPDLTSSLKVLMVKDCPCMNELTLFHSDYFQTEQKSWFPSLKKLIIGHCHHIIAWKILPLEEMGALKELELMDVPVVEELSVPSLEKLVLIKMPRLQCCSGITASPLLQVLTSQVHQKELVSSLRKLTINDCPSLIVSIPIPPSPLISDLSIKGLSAFPTMSIYQGTFSIESSELTELDGRVLPFHNLKGIRSMYLRRCLNLIHVSSEVFSHLVALERLVIQICPNLLQPQFLSESVRDNSRPNTTDIFLPSLKSLAISSCGISGSWLTQLLRHLQSLECLDLWGCPQIKFLLMSQPAETEVTSSLSSAVPTTTSDEQVLQILRNLLRSLKMLRIWGCPDLEFFGSNGGFGGCTSLVTLELEGCPKLVSPLVHETNNNGLFPTSLQDLKMSCFSTNLQSYSPRDLHCLKKLSLSSSHLKSLQLHSCTALEYLHILECQHLGVLEGLQHLSSLRRLDIEMNHELSAAWDLKLQEQEQGNNQVGIFPLSLKELWIRNIEASVHSRLLCLPSITKLELWSSPNLKSLQLGYCTALEELAISHCESLASIEGFRFIRNLRSLSILHTPSLSPYLQQQGASDIWSRLETLEIDDTSVLCMSICKHLTSLWCHMFQSAVGCNGKPMVSLMEEQEKALQHLTSLREIFFEDCDNLESLPANLRSLDSLEELYITECPSIVKLPEMGLPPSLCYLSLSGCTEELSMQCRMAETEKLRVHI